MHELSVCQALIGQVQSIARARNAGGVRIIRLRIGPLAGVEPALLETAFRVARLGTVAAEAQLVVEHASVRVRCGRCGGESAASVGNLTCGSCASTNTTLVAGNECMLVSLDLVVTELRQDRDIAH